MDGSSYLNPTGGGLPLVRQSSFERKLMALYASFSGDNVESIMLMQNWYKNIFKVSKVRSELRRIEGDFSVFSTALNRDDSTSRSFDQSQVTLSHPDVIKSLDKILIALPKDINLKTKNNVTRSSRFCLTALLISKYPGELLLVDYTPDQSAEAMACLKAAKLYVLRLKRLVNYILRFSNAPTGSNLSLNSLNEFKRLLISYRFVTRNYLELFEVWKRLDSERMVHSLETTYSDAYALYTSTETAIKKKSASTAGEVTSTSSSSSEGIDTATSDILLQQQAAILANLVAEGVNVDAAPSPEEILKSLKAELSKIEVAIKHLAKSIPSYNTAIRLEELRAMVEAQFTIFLRESNELQSSTSTPAPPPRNESINMKIAKHIQMTLSEISKGEVGDGSSISGAGASETLPGAIPQNVDKLLDKIFHFHNLNMQKSLAVDALFGNKINLLSELLVATESGNAADLFQFGVERYPESLQITGFFDKYIVAPSSASSGGVAVVGRDMASLVDKFKEDMLSLIEDRMLSTLKPSKVKSVSLLAVGDMVQILNGSTGVFYHTARILRLNSNFSDPSTTSVDASIGVKYLVDGVEENDVVITRVKLVSSSGQELLGESSQSSASSDATNTTTNSSNAMLLEQYESILDRIESLTPNLKSTKGNSDLNSSAASANPMWQLLRSLRSPIALSVPPAFLNPKDWGNICFNIYNLLMSLQASARAKTMTTWVTSYLERIRSFSAMPPLKDGEAVHNCDWMDYIPVWFRFCNMTIDVIANDISNYYLSVLGSTMDKNKVYEVVSFSFADRYLRYTVYQEDQVASSGGGSSSGNANDGSGKVPIEGTIQFLLSQMYSGNQRKTIVKKAIELGVIASSDIATDIEQMSTIEQFSKIISTAAIQLSVLRETDNQKLQTSVPTGITSMSSSSPSSSASSSSNGVVIGASIMGARKGSDAAHIELIVYYTYLQTIQDDVLKVIQGLNVATASSASSKSIVNSLETKLPEMALLDLPRLSRFTKVMAQTVTFIGFITGMKQLLMKFQICQGTGAEFSNLENEFARRLEILVFDDAREDKSEKADIDNVLAECVRFTNNCLDVCKDKSKFQETASIIRQITENIKNIVLSPSSPVILLLLSRLNQLLLFSLITNTNKQSTLFPNSSELLSRRLQTVVKMSLYILTHIFKSHSVIYTSILGSPDFATLMEEKRA